MPDKLALITPVNLQIYLHHKINIKVNQATLFGISYLISGEYGNIKTDKYTGLEEK